MAREAPPYRYNAACLCEWCSNGGTPPEGYWADGMYGRAYCVTDSYGNEHWNQSRSPWISSST